jgi:hypothetical protein
VLGRGTWHFSVSVSVSGRLRSFSVARTLS